MDKEVNIDDMEEYSVYATYEDGSTEDLGEVFMRKIHTVQDMPVELEIDGVTYKPQF